MQKSEAHRTVKTITAMGIVLLVFFCQGAAVVLNNLDGIASIAVRGLIIWGLVLVTAAFDYIKYKTLDLLGFDKPRSGTFKQLYFFVPLIVIALTNFSCGIDMGNSSGMILANLLLALGIGFCEEIYFRGMICNFWITKGERTAMLVSSMLFAVCHVLNIAGGASALETILQICFAFVYGIIFARIFIVCHSIWPCIIVHALHDFCSFISVEGTMWENIVLGAVQFAILLCYAFVIMKKGVTPRSQNNI